MLINPFQAPEFEALRFSIVEVSKVLGDIMGPQPFFDVINMLGDADAKRSRSPPDILQPTNRTRARKHNQWYCRKLGF